MAYANDVYDRFRDPSVYQDMGPCATADASKPRLFLPDYNLFLDAGLTSIKYAGTSLVYAGLPSGAREFCAQNSIVRHGHYLYAMASYGGSTSNNYNKLHKWDLRTKTWSASLCEWHINPLNSYVMAGTLCAHPGTKYIGIMNRLIYGTTTRYLYVSTFDTETDTRVVNVDIDKTPWFEGEFSSPMSSAVDELDRMYLNYVDGSSATRLIWFPCAGPYAENSIVTTGTLIAGQGGYHIRSDYPTRIYNQARSTYWILPGETGSILRISTGPTSDGTWLIATSSQVYVCKLDTGGTITYQAVGASYSDGLTLSQGSAGHSWNGPIPGYAFSQSFPQSFGISRSGVNARFVAFSMKSLRECG